MNLNTRIVLDLLAGLETGKMTVHSYTSEWIVRGGKPTSRRKMTIILDEVHA